MQIKCAPRPFTIRGFFAYKRRMKWTQYLRDGEQDELSRAEEKRDAARVTFNAIRITLKGRCEARMRRAKLKEAREAAAAEPSHGRGSY